MQPALEVEGISVLKVIMIFTAYIVFASVTFGILMVMDVLECFLHTIRLHWVEF
jgi:V-type H+-transporting ATPase subunit a